MERYLGKIRTCSFGLREGRLGYHFSLDFTGGGVDDFWGHFDGEPSEHANWTSRDRDHFFAHSMCKVGKLLREAKKQNFNDLVGVPVEVTIERDSLRSWRVLTEVIL